MVCKLCEKNEVEYWFGSWCKSCRKVKHYLNLYGDRVYEVLDNVNIIDKLKKIKLTKKLIKK